MPEVTNSPSAFLPETITAESTASHTAVAGTQFESTPASQNLPAMPALELVEAVLVGIPPTA